MCVGLNLNMKRMWIFTASAHLGMASQFHCVFSFFLESFPFQRPATRPFSSPQVHSDGSAARGEYTRVLRGFTTTKAPNGLKSP